MGNLLLDYAIRFSKGLKITTQSQQTKLFLNAIDSPLSTILHNHEDDHDSLSIEDIMESWILTQKELDPLKIHIHKYSNVLDEADAIINFSSNEDLIVATNNPLLRTTLFVKTGNFPDSNQLLKKDLWIRSAEALFMINKVHAVDYCSNHPWASQNIKSNLFNKNHLIRSGIMNVFTKGADKLDLSRSYKAADLIKFQFDFIKTISVVEDELIQIAPEVIPDRVVTKYEYIGLLETILVNEINTWSIQPDKHLSIVDIDHIPYIWLKAPIWVAGLTSNNNFMHRYCIGNIMSFSYSAMENGCKTHVHPFFVNSELEDRANYYKSYTYDYTPPCPKLSIRKNSFAINHITKLLNNPYNFYIESILKLKPHNSHPNHIVGILVHSVFEELIKKNSLANDMEAIKEEIRVLLKQNHFSKMEYALIAKKVEVMLQNLCAVVTGSSALYAEHEGIQKIIHNGREYFLHGRADLIYEKNGRYGVIDFKTGNPPSWMNIVNGSAPQISIAMLMLRFGGFLNKEVEHLAESGFISPKGLFQIEHDSFMLQSAIDGIKDLISAFWEHETPYYLYINDINTPYRLLARNSGVNK